MNHFKLICIDIDGTLINDNKEVSPFNQQELKRVSEAYNPHIIFVSSRMPTGIEQIANQLKINEPIVCYNGAFVLEKMTEGVRPVIFSSSIAIPLIKQILSEINNPHLYIGLYRNDEWIIRNQNYWSEREIRGTKCLPKIMNFEDYFNSYDMEATGIHKIMLRDHLSVLDKYESELRSKFSDLVTIHRIKDTVQEITPKGITKADGIKVLCKAYNLNRDSIIAFGDNYNDIELFELAGTSIAMDNSPLELKNVATEVTTSNNEDGISIILKKYFI